MKKMLSWLCLSVLLLSFAGCNGGWPSCFCRNNGGEEAYVCNEPCETGCGTASGGMEYQMAPSSAGVESVPLPGPAPAGR